MGILKVTHLWKNSQIFENKTMRNEVELEEGDGLFYKGIETPHWRDKFEGSRLAQVFLHYVRRT